MRTQIAPSVSTWWAGIYNGLYDNSLQGAANLTALAPMASQGIYYFTMSFCATKKFPEDETLTATEINKFLNLLPADKLWNFMGVWGKVIAILQKPLNWLGILPSLRAVLVWATGVANNHLGGLGYFDRIPSPGTEVPRPDMLPAIAFPSYAMGDRNDGIVNTSSMDGPVQGPIDNGSFAAQFAALSTQGVRGRYWHMGTNMTIDHADQIGVFTNATTVNLHLSKTSIPLLLD